MTANRDGGAARKELPGGSFDACVRRFGDDPNVDDPEALCGWLESQKDLDAVSEWDGDSLEELAVSLSDPNAQRVFEDLTVTYVSGVSNPAQDSQWVIAKSADHDDDAEALSTGELVVKRDAGEEQKAWAPVLIPNETDKDGDIIPPSVIEKAAHDFLAEYRKIDTDHDLIAGKGKPIESWVLKDSQTFATPNGGESREYPAGTWMLGVQFARDAWQRVKSGDITGFSIYGMADKTPVDAIPGVAKSVGAYSDMTDKNTPGDEAETEGESLEETVKSLADAVEKRNEQLEDVTERLDGIESRLDDVDEKAETAAKAVDDVVDEGDEASLDEDDVEKMTEETIKSVFGLDDDDDLDEAREIVRKATVEPNEDPAGESLGPIEFTSEDLEEVL